LASALLNDHNLGRPGHSFGCQLRVGELGVLSREIRFNYPTGSCTSFSDEDRDFKLYDFSKCLAEGRPANGGHAVRNGSPHQNSRVSRQLNTNIVASFSQRRRPNEREIGSSRILGTYQVDQQKSLGVGSAGISLGGRAKSAPGNSSGAQVTTFV
jgi:hypothetical protein